MENSESIFRYTEGMDFAQFEEDRRTYDAVERCLQRITEALISEVRRQRLRGFGNRLCHDYDSIEEDRLFDIVKVEFPVLCAQARSALEKIRDGSGPLP